MKENLRRRLSWVLVPTGVLNSSRKKFSFARKDTKLMSLPAQIVHTVYTKSLSFLEVKMSNYSGLCSCCGDWKELQGQICSDCREALNNPISPKVGCLSLSNEIGSTFRSLAKRHNPELLGCDPTIKRLEVEDGLDRVIEEHHPLYPIKEFILEAREVPKAPWYESPNA